MRPRVPSRVSEAPVSQADDLRTRWGALVVMEMLMLRQTDIKLEWLQS